MKTLLLGGNSNKNQEWLQAIQILFPADVHIYEHWKVQKDTNFAEELEEVRKKWDQYDFIMGKSLGALIAIRLAQDNPKKMLLCGIPYNVKDKFGVTDDLLAQTTATILQKTNDPKGSFENVNNVHEAVEIPGDDHYYEPQLIVQHLRELSQHL